MESEEKTDRVSVPREDELPLLRERPAEVPNASSPSMNASSASMTVSQEGHLIPVRFNASPNDTRTTMSDIEVSVVDRNVLEFRLHFPFDDQSKHNQYRISLYSFIPASLGINKHTYHRGDFYRDLQTYFSFDPPASAVHQIVAGDEPGPLVTRIIRQSLELWPAPVPGRVERLSGDLRLLGCIMGKYVEDSARKLAASIEALRHRDGALSEQDIDRIRSRAEVLLTDLVAMMPRIHDLAIRLDDRSVPDSVREIFRWVDSYLNLTIEAECSRLIAYLDQDFELVAKLGDIRAALVDIVITEQTDRFHAGDLPPLDGDPRTSERYNYRIRVLKHFVSSVLFLEVKRGQDGRRYAELAAPIAAGSAMLFSSIVLVWTQARYGYNTTPFVLILVLSYILKDRIKDWTRRYVLRKASRFHSDYSITLQDKRKGKSIGSCHELFSFVEPSNLPRSVFECRHDEPDNLVEIQSKPESIMRYDKMVEIRSNRVQATYTMRNSVQDVIRFDLTEILQRAKSADRLFHVYRPDRDVVDVLRSTNTYHLNLVLVDRSKQDENNAVIGRVRVVIDKDGIQRLEAINPMRHSTNKGPK